VNEIRETPQSDEDRVLVRQHLLDAIASAFVGVRTAAFHDLAALCADTQEGVSWPFSGSRRTSPFDGAMLWSFAMQASVFDDGSREGACHPGAVVVPVVLALSREKSWDEIDRAVAAGYEVMVRLARVGNPDFTRRGFHPTAIVAPLAAAATASCLSGDDCSRIRNALCLAAMGGAGLMASFRSEGTQPLQVACSVRNGLMAARMAGSGHAGYERILEEGFYPAHLGDRIEVAVDRPLQHASAVRGSYLKPYPGCRHVHPAIDALAKALGERKLTAPQVSQIRVGTYRTAIDTEIHELRTRGDAYFNIPYALAARLVLGRTDWDAFDERHFANGHLNGVMRRVVVRVDPEVDNRYPQERGARVEIHTSDGDVLSGYVRHALGEPEHPLTATATCQKLRALAVDCLSRQTIDRLEGILDIGNVGGSPSQLLGELSRIPVSVRI
jgi:2-methylcitrate dehydratase PrpD